MNLFASRRLELKEENYSAREQCLINVVRQSVRYELEEDDWEVRVHWAFVGS